MDTRMSIDIPIVKGSAFDMNLYSNTQTQIDHMYCILMQVNMHGHVFLHKNMNMKLKVNLRKYTIQLHMLVVCLKEVKLIGLPLPRKHMPSIDL